MSIPLLKDLLKETPDFVRGDLSSDETTEPNIAKFRDGDAYTFIALKNGLSFYALTADSYHDGIAGAVYSYYKARGKVGLSPFDYKDIAVSDVDELDKSVFEKDGDLYDFCQKEMRGKGNSRKIKNALAGRLWKDKKIISFWQKKDDVLKMWDQVEDLFKIGEFGPLDEYQIDWIERSNDYEIPLTPASTVSKSRKAVKQSTASVPEQMNFVEKLFTHADKIPSLSTAKLDAIQKQMHVLDPQVKAQVMKLSKVYVNKAASIANALGMTVAQFNHLTQVAESDSIDT